jgi:RNA polymerase sigma-70 factor (ECF subfamily)
VPTIDTPPSSGPSSGASSSGDDRALVAAAQAGDRRSLDILLRRHYDKVHAICRRIAGSSRDADDAAQEAMISSVRGLDRFDGRSAFTTWIYRIATNAALDELRKRNRRPGLHVAADDDGYTPESADPLSERTVEAVADRMAIDAALGELPDEFKSAVVLRDVCDLDYGEIAEALDIPVGTVKSRIARARAQLAQRLGNHEPPDERQNPEPSTDRSLGPAPDAPPVP